MSEFYNELHHGQPSWFDLSTPDPAAALSFYTGLFGWEPQDLGDEFDHYTIFTKGGKPVAGLNGTATSGPADWINYFVADDLDEIVKRVDAAGGTVVVAEYRAPMGGRAGLFRDITGTPFGAWQPGGDSVPVLRLGANEVISGELGTSDLGAAKAFYSEVFEWIFVDDADYPRAHTKSGNGAIGNLGGTELYAATGRPAGPDLWLTYFSSDQVAANDDAVIRLGGTVEQPCTVNVHGLPYAIYRDPQGALIGVYEYNGEPHPEAYRGPVGS